MPVVQPNYFLDLCATLRRSTIPLREPSARFRTKSRNGEPMCLCSPRWANLNASFALAFSWYRENRRPRPWGHLKAFGAATALSACD